LSRLDASRAYKQYPVFDVEDSSLFGRSNLQRKTSGMYVTKVVSPQINCSYSNIMIYYSKLLNKSMLNPESELPIEPHLTTRDAWQDEIAQRRSIGDVALSNLQEPLTVRNLEDEERAYYAITNLILASSKTAEEAATMMEHIEGIQKTALGRWPAITNNPFLEENADKIPPLIDTQPIVMAGPKVQELINSRDISESRSGLLEVWPHFQETYVAGFRKGVELGYIPASAEGRLEAALTRTSVRVADSAVLDTYGPMAAYYRNDHDEIGIRHDIEKIGENFQDNLAHEFTHKISGGTFKTPEIDNTEFNRSRVGFSTEFRPEVVNRTGLNEAVTQHVTLGIITGDFETLDPDTRADKDNSYYGYRKVLSEFVGRSRGLIDLKTITNAFFEDAGPDGGIQSRRQLVKEVRQAYGPGALSKLEKLMGLADMIGSDRFDEIIFSRMHPPELNEHGGVVKQGFIDTKNLPTFNDLCKTL